MSKLIDLYGWGRHPVHQSLCDSPQSFSEVSEIIIPNKNIIARGMGRSYGDSSLGERVLSTLYLRWLLNFDEQSGKLTCTSGVTLAEILEVFVPKGWFLAVTPGTRYITVGGAIASDVHGKNHHLHGTFCQFVTELDIILGNGEKVTANNETNSDLFRATCGGMGLTGFIFSATIILRRINSSQVVETTIKAKGLDEVLAAFDIYSKHTYSVAWVDCLAKGKELGRSLLTIGDHAEAKINRNYNASKNISIPTDMPQWILNKTTVAIFNNIYFNSFRYRIRNRSVDYRSFFYPLDKILNWNRLYGKNGFLQYQFVLPSSPGEKTLRLILETIAKSGQGSFLAVLKKFGPKNNNMLSFPIEGYTLSLDFKISHSILEILRKIDNIVVANGGRIYLAKDARMSEQTFKSSYPNWEIFEETRAKYHALGKFASLQSKRLGLK